MIAPRSFIDPASFRCAGPRAAEAPAPGRVSSLPDPGAGHSFVLAAELLTDEGDLVAVPAFARVAANRFSACACVAGREGAPCRALPSPHGFLDLAAERLRASGDRRRAMRRDARDGLRPAAAGPP